MKSLNLGNPALRLILIQALLLALYGCAVPQAGGQQALRNEEQPVVIRSVVGNYDQIWDDLTTALNNRGLVISSVSHVGEMIERTGKALNQNRKIFARAKVMEFCSAIISRKMMEQNPHYIAFCPYQIMVYSLPDNPGKVYLSYRRLYWGNTKGKDRAVLKTVENLLSGLINEVIETEKQYQ
ncbi:MAG: DUF302 domain-containing protein [Deltaproteobacteria bacterium]|nr:DUF302 domain-containing protein [Deltaproteobacteria bacterium]